MGQQILGSSHRIPQGVVLDCDPTLVGDSVSVSLSQQGDSAATWDLQCFVQLAQGWFSLGIITTTSPAAGDPPERCVAIGTCPGAIGWRVDAYCTTDNEDAELTLQSSKCCAPNIGFTKLNDPTAGATDVFVLDRPWGNAFTTGGLTNSFVAKASPGNARSLTVRVDATLATGTYYLQLWNLAAVPLDGLVVTAVNAIAAPVKIAHVSGVNDVLRYDFDEYGVPFTAGWCLNLSSTEFSKTIVAGNVLSVTSAEFR